MCTKAKALERANKRVTELIKKYNCLREECRELMAAILYIKETTTDENTARYSQTVSNHYMVTEE